MSKQEDDAFAEWQAKFAKEFEADPDAKAAWDTLTGKAGEKVREHFYRGTLRQDEFHRRLNEANKAKADADALRAQAEAIVQQSHEWYAMSKPEYEKAVKRAEVLASLVQQAGILGEADPGVPSAGNGGGGRQMGSHSQPSQSNEEVEALKAQLAGISRGLPNFMRDFAAVQTDILRNNWSVDPTAVMDYSSTRGVTLQQALADLTHEERQQRQQDEIKKQIAAGVEEEKRKIMASLPTPDFARGGPRASLNDQLKEMEALAQPAARREAGVALLREALVGGSK